MAVDGAVARDPSRRSRPGADRARAPAAAPAEPRGEAIALDVVYEDDDLIVIDKPAGPRRPSGRRPRQRHAGQRADRPLRRQPVGHRRREAAGHRAPARQGHDGLLVVAKNDRAHRGLAAQFADHGRTGAAGARLSGARLGRARAGRAAPSTRRSAAAPRNREKMAVVADGARPPRRHPLRASRRCSARAKAPVASLAALPARDRPHAPDPRPHGPYRPSAPRRRDLRRRLQDQGRPLAGAARAALDGLGRQALHAAVLGFEHPRTGEDLRFESALPADMAALCSRPCGKRSSVDRPQSDQRWHPSRVLARSQRL